MDTRMVAHAVVQSSALSPCKKFVVFGLNFAYVFVFSLNKLHGSSDSRQAISSSIKIPNCHSIKCLHTKENNLWIGSRGSVLVTSWASLILVRDNHVKNSLFYSQIGLNGTSIKCLTSLTSRNIVYGGSSDGRIFAFNSEEISLMYVVHCHDLAIYSLSTSEPYEILSCSADGSVCFWDTRTLKDRENSLKFSPSKVPELCRPSLGDFLTVASIQTNDPKWFITGGGPKLSLWNKNAGKPTAVLETHYYSSDWYPYVADFVSAQNDPKIIAGGSFGSLIGWDFAGGKLFETPESEDPIMKMSCVVTALEVPNSEPDLMGSILVGGLSPSIRLVSLIGYSSTHFQLTTKS